MKKNTLHKVMATALVGAMAMGTLTGCGGSTDAGADTSTKDTAAVAQKQAQMQELPQQ